MWLLLGTSVLLSGGLSYIFALAIAKTRMPPRVGMLVAVVIGMGSHWYLSKVTTAYLESEAQLHHLSLRTFTEIGDNFWTLNFYGAILIALVTCFVYLRTLEIPFFRTIETLEEDLGEVDEGPVPEDFDMDTVENDIPPPEFNITASDDSVDEKEVVE